MLSETGRRETNQDRACAVATTAWGKPALVMAVADGMGGMREGQAAAERAMQEICAWATDTLPQVRRGARDLADSLVDACQRANLAIWEHGAAQGLDGQVGTTLVCCVVVGSQYLVANVGDSRCYYINDHGARRLTVDHSRVQDMVRRGVMTEEAARRSPFRNELTNSLGEPTNVRVDVTPDRDHLAVIDEPCLLLLCSDGVHGHVLDEEFLETFRQTSSVREGCGRLIAVALERGSTDNLSVVAVEHGRLRGRQAVGRIPMALQGPATVKMPVTPPRRRRRLPAAAAAVLLAAGIGGQWWWSRDVSPGSIWSGWYIRAAAAYNGLQALTDLRIAEMPHIRKPPLATMPGAAAIGVPPFAPGDAVAQVVDSQEPAKKSASTSVARRLPTHLVPGSSPVSSSAAEGSRLPARQPSSPRTMDNLGPAGQWVPDVKFEIKGRELRVTCKADPALPRSASYDVEYAADEAFRRKESRSGGSRCDFRLDWRDARARVRAATWLYVRIVSKGHIPARRSETVRVELPDEGPAP